MAVMRLSLADGVNVTLAIYIGVADAIKLDRGRKRVYWLEYSSSIRNIHSCDYGGKDTKTIANGQFDEGLRVLSVLGNSLYFLNKIKSRINEMSVSNGTILRSFLLDIKDIYNDLIVFHHSVQPTGEF